MSNRRKKSLGLSRADRFDESENRRLEAISSKRLPPWVGDKMLLMDALDKPREKITHYFDERSRMMASKATEAGGDVLRAWKDRKESADTSNKYAMKMWREHDDPAKKQEYLRKLRNGLINLETGTPITPGNPEDWKFSALNPANGHIEVEGMGNHDRADESGIDGDNETANRMNQGMQCGAKSRDSGDATTRSPKSSRKRKVPQIKSQDEHDASQVPSHTNGNDGVSSQMSYHNNYFGADGANDECFREDPISNEDQPTSNGEDSASTWHPVVEPVTQNDWLEGSQFEANISGDDYQHQVISYGGETMPTYMQQPGTEVLVSGGVDTTHVYPPPNNQPDQWNSMSITGLEHWEYSQAVTDFYGQSALQPTEAPMDRSELSEALSQMEFSTPSKKRKEAPSEEGTADARAAKRQRQSATRRESQSQFEPGQCQPQNHHDWPIVGGNDLNDFLTLDTLSIEEFHTMIKSIFQNRHVRQKVVSNERLRSTEDAELSYLEGISMIEGYLSALYD